MFYFTYSLAELKAKPIIAFKGAVVCDTNSEKLTRYLIKDVVDDIPILIEIGDKSHTELPNCIGDYMLNLRTGYISIINHNNHLSDPLEQRLSGEPLISLRKEILGY